MKVMKSLRESSKPLYSAYFGVQRRDMMRERGCFAMWGRVQCTVEIVIVNTLIMNKFDNEYEFRDFDKGAAIYSQISLNE
jgi:hypothetical protein